MSSGLGKTQSEPEMLFSVHLLCPRGPWTVEANSPSGCSLAGDVRSLQSSLGSSRKWGLEKMPLT